MTPLEALQAKDPWDWDVDEVVAALCDPALPFRVNGPPTLPDAAVLEQKLREHYIDGCSLLTGINTTTLKEDLGIAPLGQRVHIQEEVFRLRWRSRQYSEHLQKRIPDIQSGPSTGRYNVGQSGLHTDKNTQRLLNELPDPQQQSLAPSPVPGAADDPVQQAHVAPTETYIIDESGRKRRRIVLGAPTPNVAEETPDAQLVESTTHEQSPRTVVEGPSNAQTVEPTAQEQFSVQFLSAVLDTSNPIPKGGQKRIAPTLILKPPDPTFLDAEKTAIGQNSTSTLPRNPEDVYLGLKGFHVDDLFYERLEPGSKLTNIRVERTILQEDESISLAFRSFSASNGQRRYVKSRMQHFLRQQPQVFCRGTNRCYGILPYPASLGPKHHSLSMTIFEAAAETMMAIRCDRAAWRLLDDARSAKKSDQATEDVSVDVHRLPLQLEEDNGVDWDFLEKWHHVDGSERILPVYGESGSEGEYDPDTWREIEKECGGKLARPLGRSKQMKKVSEDDVAATIDEAIRRMVEDWKLKKLPKLLRTAWILWAKSRRNGTKHAQISSLDYDARHLQRRLDKLREGIAQEQWISTARISRQCESMRKTVHELEESRWNMVTLKSKIRPDKPQKLPEVHLDKLQKTDSRLSVSETSEDGDLDDFIIDDDDATLQGDDVSIADEDDDDRTISDIESVAEHPQPGNCHAASSDASSPTPKREASPQLTPSANRITAEADKFIDLTLDTDASELEAPGPILASHLHSHTPPPVQLSSAGEEDPVARSQRKKALFKTPLRLPSKAPVSLDIVDLEGDSAYDSPPASGSGTRSAPPGLPALYETASISQMDPKIFMERSDRRRLLIWLLASTPFEGRRDTYAYINHSDLTVTQTCVWNVIADLRKFRRRLRDVRDHEAAALKLITAWFIQWTNVVVIDVKHGANRDQLAAAEADVEGFAPFYYYLHELECLRHFGDINDDTIANSAGDQGNTRSTDIPNNDTRSTSITQEGSAITTPRKSASTPRKKKRELIEYSDEDLQPASAKKQRKYIVPESQEAAESRRSAHERVREREDRQRSLKQRLQRMGQTEEDPSQVAVNLTKQDNQDLIYLPASIGGPIQPHQKDGVRFMWREIVEDQATGCLLAQTMGLGKTMQVISFLVAVAQAANSPVANVRDQIPERLRESRTLVLCPPSLIENWYEEFLFWAGDNMADTIGEVRKVDTSIKPHERLHTIEEWGDEGGILIIGFSILRELINNTARKIGEKIGQTPLDKDQHQTMKELLLQKPNIVVADEAHLAKNRSSSLHKIMTRFSTRSRIALTGSPLSNNLSEYYSLIEWVAPGYLGEHQEFKAHYEEPIQEGLYRDSTASQWRNGLKKLELFKREVQPKVHRADFSVLASRLKGKSEFVIKLALTPLQEELYGIFVASMDAEYRSTKAPLPATLWAWIAILRLVCNHPKLFHDKMYSKDRNEVRKKRRNRVKSSVAEELGIPDDDEQLADASPADLGVSDELLQRQLEPFQSLDCPVDDISLAYKMTTLLQILQLSIGVGDKVLVFSHSLATLDYIKHMIATNGLKCLRLDGTTPTVRRQHMTKSFNEGSVDILLVSTKAGGTGLNLFGANRVIIVDDNFNPTWEEQAIGRAYRIGQMKHVFVYRLTVGGTFEEALHNQSLFKQQLATRAVDQRNIERQATKSAKDYFQPLKAVAQTDLAPMKGKDPAVLDHILASQANAPFIRAVVPCETFQQEVVEDLTADEKKEVEREEEWSRLRRADPAAYHAKMAARSISSAQKQSFQSEVPKHSPATSLPVGVDAPEALCRAEGLARAPPPWGPPTGSHAVVVPNLAYGQMSNFIQPQESSSSFPSVKSVHNPRNSQPSTSEPLLASSTEPGPMKASDRADSEPSRPFGETVPSKLNLTPYPALRGMMDRVREWSKKP